MASVRKAASRGDQPLTPAPTILVAKPQPKAIMDEPQAPSPRTHRASGGREAKRAARSARAGVSMPYITRKIGVLRGAGRGGARDDRAQCRHHPRGNRHRVPRRSRGDRGLEGGRRRDRRRARALSARHVPQHRTGERAARFRSARAQSGKERPHRRQAHGVRAGVRLAVRAQPGRGPPLRRPSRTSATSSSSPTWRRRCITPAARSASPSTCP